MERNEKVMGRLYLVRKHQLHDCTSQAVLMLAEISLDGSPKQEGNTQQI